MNHVILKVEGMSCMHCVNSVEAAVKQAGGVAKVDLANKTVAIQYNEAIVSLATIKHAIEEQGYDIL
jgi:copper chaperone